MAIKAPMAQHSPNPASPESSKHHPGARERFVSFLVKEPRRLSFPDSPFPNKIAPMKTLFLLLLALLPGPAAPAFAQPAGPVRVENHSLADDNGPFLGLGASYFTALWRCKNDRARLEQIAGSYKQQKEYRNWLAELRRDIYWEIKTDI